MQILVISLAGIGDTLFATPLIQELRANFPKATIDALVMWSGARDVLEGNPNLNHIYQKNLISGPTLKGMQYLWHLRKKRYDFSFNTHPQSKLQYRGVARFIGARVRISHTYHNWPILDKSLVNCSIPQDYNRHSVENNLALLSLADAKTTSQRHQYEIYLEQSDRVFAGQFIAEKRLDGRTLLGVHVGSGGTKNLALRRWPLTNYAALLKKLLTAFPNLSILLFGGSAEAADNDQLLAELGTSQVLYPFSKSLREAAALVARCDAFLSVDTALMHVAAAMQVPTQFVIETPTWNKPIQPYRPDFTLIPNPRVAGRNLEFYRYDGAGIRGTDQEIIECMQSVTVDAVYAPLARALSLESAL